MDVCQGARLGARRLAVVTVLVAATVLLVPSAALAAVSVDRASLSSGGSLRVEGRGALASATVTVVSPESTASARADGSGRFKVNASSYRSSTCRATVGDGSTSVTVTLSGCTPTSTTSPSITPQVAELGPGYVGSDFTTFSSTTTTLTFGPGTLGPVRFTVITGALPAGLQLLDQNDGSSPNKAVNASVVGTPTTEQTSTFTVRATDANGLTATRSYSIVVNPPRTLEIVPQTWAPLAVGEFSNLWIDGKGGVKPYAWTRTAGQLPPGMSLVQDNPDGALVRISGTPTTAGTYTFTLRLTDARAATTSRTFTVTVPPPDTSTGPAAPTLLAPADGAGVTTPFTIDWTEEFDPSLSANGGYNWQVSASSTFSTLALADSTSPSVTQDTVSGLASGTWFWRVQAVDGQLRSSPFSAPRSFTVTGSTTDQPGTSVLSLPPYGSSFHPFESFGFTWTAAERAVKYELLTARDSTFTTGLSKIDNIEKTSTGLVIGDFCGGCEQGTYFARVTALDAEGDRGTPSNTVSFSISYNAPLPPAPSALAPAAGATVSLPIRLDWSDVPNPQDTGYEVEIARNSSFSDIEDHIPQITPSERTVLTLSSGTKFWRVRSHQGMSSPTTTAPTAWSATRSFTVPSTAAAVQSVWLGAPPCADPCPGADTLSSGQEINGSIQLTTAAPAGGAVVTLASSPSTGASHPSSVTVPAGSAFAGFTLFAGQVSAPTSVTLTATLGSSSDTFVFTVHPTTVKSVTFCCDSTGGLPAAAHLSMTGQVPAGGLTVSLTSSSPLAQPPATVTLAAGAFSIPVSIPTSQVTAVTTMTISATLNGTTVSAPLKLYPQQPPTSLVLDRTETNGTSGASGQVRIATGQEHEVLMRLTSSHPAIARVPVYAQIPFLGTVGPFSVTTEPPAASTAVTITATGAGVSVSTTLTVHPVGGPTGGPSISTLSLSPSSVTGGATSTGTVTLTAPAPSGGAAVTLSSSSTAAATVPAGVSVPAGQTSASFPVTSKAVTTSTDVQITGVYGGIARGAVLTVTPAAAPPPPSTATLTVTATGRSGERVTSSPAGISVTVGSTGSAAFTTGTAVTLSATNSRDVVWSGACSSSGSRTKSCTFTLNTSASVTANVQ